MKFTKMHGLGNDYVYVDGFTERVIDAPHIARAVSDRHRGVGGDGLIIVQPPSQPGFACRMEMYNADGSRAGMCGNGIRCVGKFALDRGLAKGPAFRVETDAGPRELRVVPGPERTGSGFTAETWIEVDMGAPRLLRREIPLVDRESPDSQAIGAAIESQGRSLRGTAVSMGNPHFVIRVAGREPFGAGLQSLDLAALGPPLERHPVFPERSNIEFVEPRSPREINFRVWERGSGETQACGTGACAAVVAGVLEGWCERSATVHLLGGDLHIRWDEASGNVFMTGPAVEVFRGEIDIAGI